MKPLLDQNERQWPAKEVGLNLPRIPPPSPAPYLTAHARAGDVASSAEEGCQSVPPCLQRASCFGLIGSPGRNVVQGRQKVGGFCLPQLESSTDKLNSYSQHQTSERRPHFACDGSRVKCVPLNRNRLGRPTTEQKGNGQSVGGLRRADCIAPSIDSFEVSKDQNGRTDEQS